MKDAIKLIGWCIPTAILMIVTLSIARSMLSFRFVNLALIAPISSLIFVYIFFRRRSPIRTPPNAFCEIAPLALFILGYLGSTVCFYSHLCIGGHMDHPELISESDYYLDWSWAIALVSSAYVALRIRSRFAFHTCSLVAFILIYRFLLESFGGQFSIPI